jgi:ribosomal protein S15P/S13E
LKKNRHDYNTERSLVLLVGKKDLFGLLEKKEINRYREIIKVLGMKIINILKRRASASLFKIKKSLVFIGF